MQQNIAFKQKTGNDCIKKRMGRVCINKSYHFSVKLGINIIKYIVTPCSGEHLAVFFLIESKY